jgi:hypothetical protein
LFFAKTVEEFKEGVEGLIRLSDEEDPGIIGIVLRFMYKQNYTVPIRARESSQSAGARTPGVYMKHWIGSQLTHRTRSHLHHGLMQVDAVAIGTISTMVRSGLLGQLVNALYTLDTMHTDNNIGQYYAQRDSLIYPTDPGRYGTRASHRYKKKPESKRGTPWHIDDHDNGELHHVKVCKAGNFYDIGGLSRLALGRVSMPQDITFDPKVGRDVVQYLMMKTN